MPLLALKMSKHEAYWLTNFLLIARAKKKLSFSFEAVNTSYKKANKQL